MYIIVYALPFQNVLLAKYKQHLAKADHDRFARQIAKQLNRNILFHLGKFSGPIVSCPAHTDIIVDFVPRKNPSPIILDGKCYSFKHP